MFGRDAPGLPAPQIDGQLPGHRDNGLFAFASVTAGLQQDVLPLLHGLALRLELDHAPGQFDQQVAQPGVAVFGDAQVHVGLAAGTDPAAQAGQRTDLSPIGEATPVADLILGGGQRQRTAAEGAEFGRLFFHRRGQGGELFLHGGQHGAIKLEAFTQPGGQLFPQFGPLAVVPPIAQFAVMPLGEHQAFAHRIEPLAFAAELFALAADTAALLLRGRGHAHGGESLVIAGEIPVQAADQFGRIGLVGVDAFAEEIELHGPDDVTGDPPGGELPGQPETARPGFIDGKDLLGLGELFFDEHFEVGAGIDPLRRLRACAIELADDPQMLGVLIDAQEDAVVRRFCRLRCARGCGDFNQILVMSVGLHIEPMFDGFVGRRMTFRPHFKLPPVAALANTHAILGR